MSPRRVTALGAFGLGPVGALVLGGSLGGCGGTSVAHVGSGGVGGGGQGGLGGALAGATALAGKAPICDTLGEYAGPENVDSDRSPDESCDGLVEYCDNSGSMLLATCDDAGAPLQRSGEAAFLCPTVRSLCHTGIGCCEDTFTLIAGPRVIQGDTLTCCYAAEPGFHGR